MKWFYTLVVLFVFASLFSGCDENRTQAFNTPQQEINRPLSEEEMGKQKFRYYSCIVRDETNTWNALRVFVLVNRETNEEYFLLGGEWTVLPFRSKIICQQLESQLKAEKPLPENSKDGTR